MTAILHVSKLQQEELHNYERPISYLAFQTAELNRDHKKQRKPFKPTDFYFYENKELANLPEPKFGAAAMALIQNKQFPGWALFAYNDLKSRAGDALAPELLCVQCDDAILLAPSIEETTVLGMLIAQESASGAVRTMISSCGLQIEVKMPKINNKYEAHEDAELQLMRIVKKHQSF